MKFTKFLNVFVVLATASSVYGANGIQDLTNCESQLESYKICNDSIIRLTPDQIKERCSEKCQSYFSDPKTAVNSCYESGVEGLFPDLNEFNVRKLAQDIVCSSCPIADFFLNPSIDSESLMNLVKKNCQSTECNKTFMNYLPSLINGLKLNRDEKSIAKFTDILNFVKSEQCINSNKPVKTTTTTVQTTVTIPTSGAVATPKPSKPRRKCVVIKKN